jgi:ATP dependent DNA ligase domain
LGFFSGALSDAWNGLLQYAITDLAHFDAGWLLVTALLTDEEWTFEVKFDGYRCIAVKRGREVTLFSRHKKVLNRRFSRVVQALASLGATSFSMVNWSPSMRKGDLPFSFCKTTSRGLFRFISTPLTSSTVAGNFC